MNYLLFITRFITQHTKTMILESITLSEIFENDDNIHLMTKKLPSKMTMKLKLKLTALPIKTDANKPVEKPVDKSVDKSINNTVEISDITSEDSDFENPNIQEDNSEINVDETNVDENKHDTPNDQTDDTTDEEDDETSTNTDKVDETPQQSFLYQQPRITIINSTTNIPCNTIWSNNVMNVTTSPVITNGVWVNGYPAIYGTLNY